MATHVWHTSWERRSEGYGDGNVIIRALQWIGLKTLQGIYSLFSELSNELSHVWQGLAVALHSIAAVAQTREQILGGNSNLGTANPAPC
jgi:hypothetical protein